MSMARSFAQEPWPVASLQRRHETTDASKVKWASLVMVAIVSGSSFGCVDLTTPSEVTKPDGAVALYDSSIAIDTRAPPDGSAGPPLVFDFESDTQRWSMILDSRSKGFAEPMQSDEQAQTGTGSLRLPIAWSAKDENLFVGIEADTGELGLRSTVSKITFNFWLPPDHKVGSVQAFILGFNAPLRWQSVNNFQQGGLRAGDWTTFELAFADGYPVAPGLTAIGLELSASAAWSGAVFVDNVKVEFVAP